MEPPDLVRRGPTLLDVSEEENFYDILLKLLLQKAVLANRTGCLCSKTVRMENVLAFLASYRLAVMPANPFSLEILAKAKL